MGQQQARIDFLFSRLRLPKFSVAFQPIYDAHTGRTHAFEALARGANGEGYPQLTSGLKASGQRCLDRVSISKALHFASKHRQSWAGSKLTVNLRPNLKRAADDATFVARRARRYGIDPSEIILELTETVKINCSDLKTFLDAHHQAGFTTAIDDFGAGYAGFSLLADCAPKMIKLDRAMATGIDQNEHRQKIVGGFVAICGELGTELVAEGVETAEEYRMLRKLGVRYMQGYLLARPAYEAFPRAVAPDDLREERGPMEQIFSGFEGFFQNEAGALMA